jgi:hypothetical protein
MLKDLRLFVKTCSRCQLNSKDTHHQPAPIQPIAPTIQPFRRWGIDFIGPISDNPSVNGNRYIVTAIDYATKWVEAKAVPDITTESFIHFLYEHIVVRHGCPWELITDNGSAFLSHAATRYMELLNIKHHMSTPYHPQSNGCVERMHGTLVPMIRKLAQESNRPWDDLLSQCLLTLRMRTHQATGYSPFFLLHGFHPTIPGDSTHPQALDYEDSSWIDKNHFIIKSARETAFKNLTSEAGRMSRNNPPEPVRYAIGEFVKLKNQKATKLSNQWTLCHRELWRKPHLWTVACRWHLPGIISPRFTSAILLSRGRSNSGGGECYK